MDTIITLVASVCVGVLVGSHAYRLETAVHKKLLRKKANANYRPNTITAKKAAELLYSPNTGRNIDLAAINVKNSLCAPEFHLSCELTERQTTK